MGENASVLKYPNAQGAYGLGVCSEGRLLDADRARRADCGVQGSFAVGVRWDRVVPFFAYRRHPVPERAISRGTGATKLIYLALRQIRAGVSCVTRLLVYWHPARTDFAANFGDYFAPGAA